MVIADDQELVRAGFTMVINSQADMQVVGQASDGTQAVQLVERLHPDIVLMDVRMPSMDGLAWASSSRWRERIICPCASRRTLRMNEKG